MKTQCKNPGISELQRNVSFREWCASPLEGNRCAVSQIPRFALPSGWDFRSCTLTLDSATDSFFFFFLNDICIVHLLPPFSLWTFFFISDSLYRALYRFFTHGHLEVILHVYLYVSFGKEARWFLGRFWANSDIQLNYLKQCLGPRQIASFDLASYAKSVYWSTVSVNVWSINFFGKF